VDENQSEIVKALLDLGCTVQSLSAVGLGIPDLLVGFAGVNILMEVKNPDRKGGKENSSGTLKRQREWRSWWKGAVYEVTSPERAVAQLREALVDVGLEKGALSSFLTPL
jgi:hypothetical protein